MGKFTSAILSVCTMQCMLQLNVQSVTYLPPGLAIQGGIRQHPFCFQQILQGFVVFQAHLLGWRKMTQFFDCHLFLIFCFLVACFLCFHPRSGSTSVAQLQWVHPHKTRGTDSWDTVLLLFCKHDLVPWAECAASCIQQCGSWFTRLLWCFSCYRCIHWSSAAQLSLHLINSRQGIPQ